MQTDNINTYIPAEWGLHPEKCYEKCKSISATTNKKPIINNVIPVETRGWNKII